MQSESPKIDYQYLNLNTRLSFVGVRMNILYNAKIEVCTKKGNGVSHFVTSVDICMNFGKMFL